MNTAATLPDPPTAPSAPAAPSAPDGSAVTTAPVAPRRPDPVDDSRPFGAHLRLSWWKPLVIIPVLLIAMFVLQIVLVLVVMILETALFGRDPMDATISPLMMLATNLSLAAMGPLAVLAMALIGRVPWRRLLASPRRMSLRRTGVYAAAFSALVLAALGVMQLIAPASTGLSSFVLTGTTVGLLVVALLSTPLQAAGEELMFRGAIMPAAASWVRAAKPALVLGMAISTILFGLVHMSVDPWLLSYYTLFGLCMAAMAVISRGLEAPIAFHVSNNLILMVLSALFAGGEGLVIDRSVGMGGPFMLVFMAVDVLAVALVWLLERRRKAAEAAA